MLDSASQSNFITESTFNELRLKGKAVNLPISGINNSTSYILKETSIVIQSRVNSASFKLSCLVLPEITQKLPQTSFNKYVLNLPDKIELADPTFHMSSQIHVLLGADIFLRLMCIGQQSLGKQLPIMQKTLLGWVISGPLVCNTYTNQRVHKQSVLHSSSIVEASADDSAVQQ